METHDDYGLKAGGYLAQLESFSTYFGPKLSHLVFSGAEQLLLTLQGKDMTIQEATMAAELTIQHLQRQRSDSSFDQFYSQLVEESKYQVQANEEQAKQLSYLQKQHESRSNSTRNSIAPRFTPNTHSSGGGGRTQLTMEKPNFVLADKVLYHLENNRKDRL